MDIASVLATGETVIKAPGILQTWGPWLALMAGWGGWKLIASWISKRNGKVWGGFSFGANGGNGRSGRPANDSPAGLCPLHREFEKRLDERHVAMQESLSRIEDGQGKIEGSLMRVHERIDHLTRM